VDLHHRFETSQARYDDSLLCGHDLQDPARLRFGEQQLQQAARVEIEAQPSRLPVASQELVAKGRKDIPKIFQLRTAAENRSLYNTPPTFGIYMVRNVLSWVKDQGGLEAIERRNRAKAAKLYAVIDAHQSFYRCPVERQSRSVMNVVFRLPSEAQEEAFVGEAKKRGMVGLKGHRSVGGIRVSLYNAVEPAWVDALCSFMQEFTKRG
jgi:phosphoserine aminotransferase